MRTFAALGLVALLAGCAPEPPAFTWTPVAPKLGTDVVLTGKRFPSERPVEIWLQKAPAGAVVAHVRGAEPDAIKVEDRSADAAGGFETTYRLSADAAGPLKLAPGDACSWVIFYGDAAEPIVRPFTLAR